MLRSPQATMLEGKYSFPDTHAVANSPEGLSPAEIQAALNRVVAEGFDGLKRVLLIIPDFTRFHSNAGFIANYLYHKLAAFGCEADLLEALGTHVPMTQEECAAMYGDIPFEKFIPHDWRNDVKHLGDVPAAFVEDVSEGLVKTPVEVEVNRRLFDGYDAIFSIGQVVPHEVVGMANHTKNIFVGCGGSAMINASHMLGAYFGMERIMGRGDTPVRKVFDYAAEHYLSGLPICYILTVTDAPGGNIRTHGIYTGAGRECFSQAALHAQRQNIILTEEPLQKVVVFLDEQEFKSTWLGNKSIYRTRMALADGGELIVLAPGVERFGEDPEVDALIRKYGYCGRENVIRLSSENADLSENLSAAAHLIHGSGDGRFTITYCTRHLSREEVEGVNFRWRDFAEAADQYDPTALTPGKNILPDGEELYYIPNPALGLWAERRRFELK